MSSVQSRYGLEDRHIMQLQHTLLGSIRRFDENGDDTIHPANFQRAIEALGLKFGDDVVDRVMVMCRTTETGLVDYSRFARHLVRHDGNAWQDESDLEIEAAVRDLSVVGRRGKAMIGQSLNPFEDRDAAARREYQAQQLRDHREELRALFAKLESRLITSQEFEDAIVGMNIETTSQLSTLLIKNQSADVPFGNIYRALSNLDEMVRSDKKDYSAGSRITKENDDLWGIRGLTKKRSDPRKNQATFLGTGTSQKNKKKNDIAGRKKELAESRLMKAILDDGEVRHRPMSAMRAKMQEGIQQRVTENISSEQRVMRQQIFAAIRKMDTGELTASQFKDRMMTIGIELPPDILKLLIDYNATGCATFNTFASAFERLLEDREAENTFAREQVDEVFATMLAVLRASGDVLALQRLSQKFKAQDSLGSGKLSLREFQRVLQSVWPGLTEAQVAMVFNEFDPQGTGRSEYGRLAAKLRGSMSTRRHECINKVFVSLPKNSRGHISPQVLAESFKPAQHPEARSGLKKGAQVLTEFNDTFELDGEYNSVTLDNFVDYYTNVSTLIQSDDEFIDLIRSCWNLSDEAPVPMHYRIKSNGDRVMSPAAAQHHGNILAWNQQSGSLESRVKQARPGRRILNTQLSSFALVHGEADTEGNGKSKKLLRNDPVDLGLTARKALQWDQVPPLPHRSTRPRQEGAAGMATSSIGDEDIQAAGRGAQIEHPHEVKEKAISFQAHLHHLTKTPYGLDQQNRSGSSAPSSRKPTPMSLKDLMGAGQGR